MQAASFFVWVCCVSLLSSKSLSAADFSNIGGSVRDNAQAVLALLGYIAVPDATTSSLSVDSSSGDTKILLVQYAGGFTVDDEFPLYLEGGVGFSRYDPVFVATDGREEVQIGSKWNSVAGTLGVGWGFPLTSHWTLRPIGNFTLGYVSSDLAAIARIIEEKTDLDLSFLDNGRLNAYGYGGSLMLDYENYREQGEIDIEIRFTGIRLESFGGTTDVVAGGADASTAALWARWRAPTGYTLLNRPLRYVTELAHSHFLGDQKGALGFDYLTQIGAGLELDTSDVTGLISRARLVGRYVRGNGVSGYSVGVAVSF